MPVTEHVLLTTASGTVTPAYRAACAHAIEVQDAWCAAHLPTILKARGVAVFQQVGDPAATLLTAHWDSVAQHNLWIASPENGQIFALLQEHLDMTRFTYFHVDGVAAFSHVEEANGAVPVLRSPVVGVARYAVETGRKVEFERVWTEVKGAYDGFVGPYVHRGGWRIEKESEGREEFVVVGGWESAERANALEKAKELTAFREAIKAVVVWADVKLYTAVQL
ncbi:hypothetical protein C8F04DRAFT_1069193 [Mycena alexandri]|uniref:ABM domain-containing protein n=1 Tax=Mycena alexandri TaxID=1745969 RepID=A0AAD6TI76_9AGAR|nr:hypothetical protein C8F04DRAFT_1069193 [Mycena alexandri]